MIVVCSERVRGVLTSLNHLNYYYNIIFFIYYIIILLL